MSPYLPSSTPLPAIFYPCPFLPPNLIFLPPIPALVYPLYLPFSTPFTCPCLHPLPALVYPFYLPFSTPFTYPFLPLLSAPFPNLLFLFLSVLTQTVSLFRRHVQCETFHTFLMNSCLPLFSSIYHLITFIYYGCSNIILIIFTGNYQREQEYIYSAFLNEK